jgi:hypothetical protein
MTADLKCEEDIECGRIKCSDYINRAMSDAAKARTMFESIVNVSPTLHGAERAEEAKALHEKSLRAINLAVERREETCEPIDFENL